MNRQRRQQYFAMHLHSLSGVLLLVFLLRALIPAGYMPTPARAGALAMTLCITGLPASVMKTLALDPAGATSEPQALECAFAAAVSQAALLLAALAVAIAMFMVLRPAAFLWERLIAARLVRGPPLGSRAPPVVA